MDKPFEVGHFIAFGDYLGTVKKVGIKTTRISSLSGEELVIGNSKLLDQNIRNYTRMDERRVVFGFCLDYHVSRKQAEEIVAATRQCIENEDVTRFDRGHTIEFAQFGLKFEFVYYVLSPNFGIYRDVQQRVNSHIMDLLDNLQIAFAVPGRAAILSNPLDDV